MSRRSGAYISHWITNWRRSTLPVPLRLAVAARNLTLRVVRRDTCCGYHGEPGC